MLVRMLVGIAHAHCYYSGGFIHSIRDYDVKFPRFLIVV